MKINLIIVFAMLMLNLVLSSQMKTKQIFDMLAEGLDPSVTNRPILVSTVNTQPIENKSINTKKESLTLKKDQNANNESDSNLSSSIKSRQENNSKLQKSEKDKSKLESQELKEQVLSLLEANSRFKKRLKHKDITKQYKKYFNKKISKFIKRYEADVNSFKQNLNYNNIAKDELSINAQELNTFYKSTSQNISELKEEVESVNKKLSKIDIKTKKVIKKTKSNFKINDLKINNKLYVEGSSILGKANAQSIDLGNVKLDKNGITFKNNKVKINVGKEKLSIGQLMKIFKQTKALIKICGKNFEHCQPISQEYFKEQATKQQAILKGIHKLRTETSEVLSSPKMRFRQKIR